MWGHCIKKKSAQISRRKPKPSNVRLNPRDIPALSGPQVPRLWRAIIDALKSCAFWGLCVTHGTMLLRDNSTTLISRVILARIGFHI